MSDSTSKRPQAETGYTEIGAATAAQTAGELLALMPDPTCQIAGAALKGGAGLIAKTAGAVQAMLHQRKHERVVEVLTEVATRAAEEGLTDEVVEQGDVLTAAFSVAGDAETEEKRRMIAEVILNAASDPLEHGRNAEAQTALHLIGNMSPQAALLFSLVAADYRESGTQCISGDVLDMPEAIAALALKEIGWRSWRDEDGNDRFENYGERRPVLEYRVMNSPGIHWIRLLPLGEWLADWVIDNRSRSTPDE